MILHMLLLPAISGTSCIHFTSETAQLASKIDAKNDQVPLCQFLKIFVLAFPLTLLQIQDKTYEALAGSLPKELSPFSLLGIPKSSQTK